MRLRVKQIRHAVGLYYKVPLGDLLNQSRKRKVARPRMIGMYLSRQLTDRSLTLIGQCFGNRDHTTVLSACSRIEALMQTDERLRDDIAMFRRVLVPPADDIGSEFSGAESPAPDVWRE